MYAVRVPASCVPYIKAYRRTPGEAKAAFQEAYRKPTPMLAQGFVGELLTSVTLATVHPTYKYTRVLAVGFEALCDSFLVGRLTLTLTRTRTRTLNLILTLPLTLTLPNPP